MSITAIMRIRYKMGSSPLNAQTMLLIASPIGMSNKITTGIKSKFSHLIQNYSRWKFRLSHAPSSPQFFATIRAELVVRLYGSSTDVTVIHNVIDINPFVLIGSQFSTTIRTVWLPFLNLLPTAGAEI